LHDRNTLPDTGKISRWRYQGEKVLDSGHLGAKIHQSGPDLFVRHRAINGLQSDLDIVFRYYFVVTNFVPEDFVPAVPEQTVFCFGRFILAASILILVVDCQDSHSVV
jgi:hypothetical protein